MLLKCVCWCSWKQNTLLVMERLRFELFDFGQNRHPSCGFLILDLPKPKPGLTLGSDVVRISCWVLNIVQLCPVKGRKYGDAGDVTGLKRPVPPVKAALSEAVWLLTPHFPALHRTAPFLGRPARLPAPVRSVSHWHQRQATMRRPPKTTPAAPPQTQRRRT